MNVENQLIDEMNTIKDEISRLKWNIKYHEEKLISYKTLLKHYEGCLI